MSSKTLVRLNTRIQTSEDWPKDAYCQGWNPEIFDPVSEAAADIAKNVCAHCDVRPACLQYAMDNGEYGVWGGTTEKERRWLKRVGANAKPTQPAPQQQKPPPQPPTPRARPADHHNRIIAMREDGHGWTAIADAIGANAEAVRAYYSRHQKRVRREQLRAQRPQVGRITRAGDSTQPANHHHLVIEMATDPDRCYTHAEIAQVIGSTTDSVHSYLYRWRRKQRTSTGSAEQVAA